MARADGLYSRIVAWLKILLPLIALGMLSTLFLLSRSVEPLDTVPFLDALNQSTSGREEVRSPYYAGRTARGDIITMTADSARPEGDDKVRAESVSTRLSLRDGSEITVNAGTAELQDVSQTAFFSGGVSIDSSTGYSLTTEALISGIDRIEAESLGPVSGTGPQSTLEAGKMRITSSEDSEDVQLLFTDGVKLIYQPKRE